MQCFHGKNGLDVKANSVVQTIAQIEHKKGHAGSVQTIARIGLFFFRFSE
jgi:uncharacterized protein YqfA (UPF0365 family)